MFKVFSNKIKNFFHKPERTTSLQVISKKKIQTPRKSSLECLSKNKLNDVTIKKVMNTISSQASTRKKSILKDTKKHAVKEIQKQYNGKNQIFLNTEQFSNENQNKEQMQITKYDSLSQDTKLLDSQDQYFCIENLNNKSNQNIFKKEIFKKNQIQRCRKLILWKKNIYQCGQCEKKMVIHDSIQLACSHRIHKECMTIMICRNKYRCKKCEIIGGIKRK